MFDDPYFHALQLLSEIKLVQGNDALNSTLRRHKRLKMFLLEKQVEKLEELEEVLPS